MPDKGLYKSLPPQHTCSSALRRSPKPGALMATTLTTPRSLFTTKVARASPGGKQQQRMTALRCVPSFVEPWKDLLACACNQYYCSLTAGVRST